MKLSELKTGETGVIVKISGHGGFRKRIMEMGFVDGKIVTVLMNAPLHDPVKYKIMGYEVSLRHSESELIEVVAISGKRPAADKHSAPQTNLAAELGDPSEKPLTPDRLTIAANKKRHIINVALVGNPNCGKTSLFNFISGAHERVGNYSGVTVDAKYGYADFEDYHFEIVDLPGTYSLSAYSPEELYVRKQLTEKTPDIVINILDASNLERNLYLTTQLIDMHIPMVCALNMYDEAQKRGDNIDYKRIGELFGVPMVPTVFRSGDGVKQLFHVVIQNYEGRKGDFPAFRHLHINHGHEIEHGIADIQEHLKRELDIRQKYSTRYLAIKLLENDSETEQLVAQFPDAGEIIRHRDEAARRVKEETGKDSETAIMDAKYGFINGALAEAGYTTGKKNDTYLTTHRIDKVLTHKYLGFPIFFLILYVMFTTTFTLGQYPMDWIETGVGWLGELITNHLPDGPVKSMLAEGIIGGVGAVIVFMPQILILYFFISYMEDCGYMARAAFITDKLMHKMGLHGKSFIPLIMGFGCNVPAIMATRTIESRRSRLITMLILPLMSCSARLPIYIMITGIFFPTPYQAPVMLSLYVVGVGMAVVASRIFSKFVFKGEDTPFVMELPPYRFPTWKAIGRHTWEKGKQYLKKMGGIILAASVIVWALGYFPLPDNPNADKRERQEQSYIGRLGKAVEPLFAAQGFDWKLDVGLISGVGAKEIVASTMGVLYTDDDSFGESDLDAGNGKYELLRRQMTANVAKLHNISPEEAEPVAKLTAYAFLLFVLLYFPCVATIAAIRSETGSWKWALFAAAYTTALAWVVSAVVFQIGMLLL
ncbi:ferrous iron transport protein B [Prevotella rectalis]|uniref:ferrous iron transport protein B n=1 Tax=Prevotella rectalis TaxID=2219999 RepID=UPI00102F50C0|nr:ferrous iron transport protein B [Prevotella brunnea]